MSRNTHAKRVVTLVTGREVDDVLRDMYLDKRYTQEEIAKALDVSRDTVIRWLAEYGISRDDRPAIEPLVSA